MNEITRHVEKLLQMDTLRVLNFNTIQNKNLQTHFAEIEETQVPGYGIGISFQCRYDVDDIDASSGIANAATKHRGDARKRARQSSFAQLHQSDWRSIELKGFRACKRLRPTARTLTGWGPEESFPPHKG